MKLAICQRLLRRHISDTMGNATEREREASTCIHRCREVKAGSQPIIYFHPKDKILAALGIFHSYMAIPVELCSFLRSSTAAMASGMAQVATAAFALLLALVALGALLRKRRRHFAPVAGSIFHQLLYFDTLHDYHARLSAKHRTFRLFSPLGRQVYTVDPANVEYILKTNFSNYGKGWYNYDKLSDLLGDGIFAVDGEKWRHQRKLASFEFSTKVLREFSGSAFKSSAAKLARAVSDMSSGAGQSVDLQDLLLKTTMDSIFKVGFGVELNCLDGSSPGGSEFARAFDECSAISTRRYVDISWKIRRLLNVGHEALFRKNLDLIDRFVNEIIQAKMEALSRSASGSMQGKKGDMLSRFLVGRENDPKSSTHKYLRDMILSFVIAGKDTTAGTLAWFFYMICKHPSVQEKAAKEISKATKASSTDTGFEEFASSITDESLDKMHYLHAALSETLRLYPAVPLDPKVCFSDDTLPDGFEINRGDVVFYQPYAMGRMNFLWGEDAEAFRPERWLDANGTFCPESPFKFTAFQAGPRICLGKEFAYRQMKIFVAVLLRFFKFRLSDESKTVNYRTMITLHIDGGVHVCTSPRQ